MKVANIDDRKLEVILWQTTILKTQTTVTHQQTAQTLRMSIQILTLILIQTLIQMHQMKQMPQTIQRIRQKIAQAINQMHLTVIVIRDNCSYY